VELEAVNKLAKVDPGVLGGRIRDLRRSRSMTQAQLAGGEVTVGYISRIETGQRRPDVRLIELFARQLETTPEFLITGITPEREDSERLTIAAITWALEEGDAGRAQELAGQLLSSASDDSSHRRAQLLYAQALESQGHLQEAIVQLEAVRQAVDADSMCAASLALSRCYREAGELDRAVAVGEQALAWLRERHLDDSDEAIQITVTVAAAYFERGDTNYAVRLCRTACDRAENTGSLLARASAYWNASTMESLRGATESAVSLAETALSFLRVQADVRNLARLQGQLGTMLLRTDPPRIDEATELLTTACRQLTEHGGSAIDLARCNVALAKVHLLRGDRPAAESIALGVSEQLRGVSPTARAEALAILGELAAQSGNTKAAGKHYAEAVAALTSVGSDRAAAQLWFELASRLEALGDVNGALAAYRSASAAAGLRPSPSTQTQDDELGALAP
jgi:tetratricopeptide (TPR) repeat protein